MYKAVLALALMMVVASLLHAAPVATVRFSMDDLAFEQRVHGEDTFQVPRVAGASFGTGSLGVPYLPFKTVLLLVPQDRTCAGVNVTYAESQVLDGAYYIYPTQTPVMFGEEPGPLIEPDSAIYASDSVFPRSAAAPWHEGYRYGYKLVAVRVYPLTYRPASRELTFHNEIRVSLDLETCENGAVLVLRRSPLTQGHIERVISGTVSNPEDVRGYFLGRQFRVEGGSREPKRLVITDLPSLQGNTVDYVLITTDELADSFKPLQDWKTRKGVVTTIRTVSWIDEHYSGCDRQERIRNFIKDAWHSWGTAWVLIGGDTRLIPPRWTSEYLDRSCFPTDLYYSCLDGSWNKNGNDIFGEPDVDSADWDHDVELGRAPVETPAEVAVFLRKDSVYSRNPPCGQGDGYLSRSLMAAAIDLGCVLKEEIISMIRDTWPDVQTRELYGPRRDPVGDLWEGDDSLSPVSFELALQQGYHFVNHWDDSWPWGLGAWVACPDSMRDRYFTQAQVRGLANGPHYSIVWSSGCSTCPVDHECIAEDFVNNPAGGAVAYIGNAGVTSGNPEANSDREFFRAIFERRLPTLGAAFGSAQASYDFVAAKNRHLLGDPELELWTVGDPQPLQVAFSGSIPLAEQSFVVTVTSDSAPVCSALVCVYKEFPPGEIEVYAQGRTNGNGKETLSIRPEAEGWMSVVATADNCLPVQSTCSVVSNGSAYVRFSSCLLIDDDTSGLSDGNGDHVVNPGETVNLTVELQNTGGDSALDVSADLSTTDAYVTVLQQHGELGDIASQSTASDNVYLFRVDSCRPDTLPVDIEFSLTILSGDSALWTDEFRLPVLSDSAFLCGSRLVEGPENTFTLDSLAITNYGWGAAAGVEAVMTSLDTGSYVVEDSLSAIGDISAGSTAVSYDSFVYRCVADVPNPPPESFLLTIRDRYGRSWQREIDMEAPPAPDSVSCRHVGDDYIQVVWDSVAAPDLKGY